VGGEMMMRYAGLQERKMTEGHRPTFLQCQNSGTSAVAKRRWRRFIPMHHSEPTAGAPSHSDLRVGPPSRTPGPALPLSAHQQLTNAGLEYATAGNRACGRRLNAFSPVPSTERRCHQTVSQFQSPEDRRFIADLLRPPSGGDNRRGGPIHGNKVARAEITPLARNEPRVLQESGLASGEDRRSSACAPSSPWL